MMRKFFDHWAMATPHRVRHGLANARRVQVYLLERKALYQRLCQNPELRESLRPELEKWPLELAANIQREASAKTEEERADARVQRSFLRFITDVPEVESQYILDPAAGLKAMERREALFKQSRSGYLFIVGFPYFLGWIGIVCVFVLLTYLGFVDWFIEQASSGGKFRQALFTCLLMLAGLLLFVLRKYRRRTYALTELAVATVAGYFGLEKITKWTDLPAWIPLATTIYLVVRAFDNFDVGIKEAAAKRQKEEEEQRVLVGRDRRQL